MKFTAQSLSIAGFVLVAGCATANHLLVDNEPLALQAATDRAKFDLPCANPTVKLVSREMTAPSVGQGQWASQGRLAKYVILAEGCDKSKTLTVYCQEGDVGCKILENDK